MRRGTRSRTSALLGTLVLGLTLAAAMAAAPAASEPHAAAGKLEVRGKLRLISGPLILPCTGPLPGPPPRAATGCQARTGTGVVRGLGNVSVSYTWLLGVGRPACTAGFAKPLATIGRLSVAGKGDINFAVDEGARCFSLEGLPGPGWFDWLYEPQEFTITGGTGPYAGASGSGKIERLYRSAPPPGKPEESTEYWTGTLAVPGLEFDESAPKLHGASSRTVRVQRGAKSRRVTFNVTATDRVDGAVEVSCRPRPGSSFKLGKTRVDCSATDSSGNTAKAAFTVTVRR
jgi:HYR domain